MVKEKAILFVGKIQCIYVHSSNTLYVLMKHNDGGDNVLYPPDFPISLLIAMCKSRMWNK